MSDCTLVMPRMGESVVEATVLGWLKKEGERVFADTALVEVATDKVDSEVPASYEGTLKKMLVSTGEVVRVGAPLAIIETNHSIPDKDALGPAATAHLQEMQTTSVRLPRPHTKNHTLGSPRTHSPLVDAIAAHQNISQETLSQIPPTGQDHRLTKSDVISYLKARDRRPPQAYSERNPDRLSMLISPQDRIVNMSRIQRLTAEKMIRSKRTAPHVTSFLEADVSDVVAWRSEHRSLLEQKNAIKLTYTPLFVHAIAQTLRHTPALNAWIDQDRVVQKHDINIGLATALPAGDLIVPVIKRADTLTVSELSVQIHDTTIRARMGTLKPEDTVGATYTISNIGTFGNTMGTPIIVQPQVAILALGQIVKKPVVRTTGQGDEIQVRSTMCLSHTYDHRVINGAVGGGFLQDLAHRLSSFSQWVRGGWLPR